MAGMVKELETTLKFGYEKGETCWREGCQGMIDEQELEGCCSCHINPPCGFCTTPREVCPECGWTPKDDEKASYIHVGGGLSMQVDNHPLDPRKIDYRIHSHTHFSQICRGVYPDGTTQDEVLAKVKGTFGGRFNYFKEGKFEYVAYTD